MSAAYLAAPHIHVVQRCRKIAFETRQKAYQVRRDHKQVRDRQELTPIGRGKWTAYRCGICGNWHVGHQA